MSRLSEYALSYARAGNRVFPCREGGKEPLVSGGFKSATTHEGVVEDWWTRWPNANIGWAIEHCVVIDVDPRNGGPRTPAHIDLPRTKTVLTPNGGFHLYFFLEDEDEDVSFVGQWPGMKGVDIKAPGKGYVLLPPSGLGSLNGGTEFRIYGEYKRADDYPVQPLPQDVLTLLTRKAPTLSGDAVVTRRAFFPWEDGSRYGQGVLRKRVFAVRTAPEGRRNNTLFKATAQVAQFIAGGELDEDYALGELLKAALDAGLDIHEAIPTIRSAYEVGVADPRRKA